MKIVVCVRTRDESANIERFCRAHYWADKILVADGGSVDNTIGLATQFANVEVRSFPMRKALRNGMWINPGAAHLNFLLDWAISEKATWIIFSNCDEIPNENLQREVRALVKTTDMSCISVIELFLWRNHYYFPRVSQVAKLWGCKANSGLRFEDIGISYRIAKRPLDCQECYLPMPPYCLLNFGWVDDNITNYKIEMYNKSGRQPVMQHPTKYAGEPKKLPEWAHE